jgi:two-component system, chemotaxis family, CheB/CheR fusion protein
VAEPKTDPELELLLEYLRRSRGFDFTGYKRASLSRRIDKRMQVVGADGYLSYLDHLEVDPEEFTQLFNTILINVTSFFRDAPAWDYLRDEILPRLAADKRHDGPIRIWSAGCASGEEAYTLAMVTAEALGSDMVRERVKIYATDVDEDALNQARLARYADRQVEGVPPDLLGRYFERNGSGYVFSKDLRRSVIFGRHDLIQDAPISRIDLLVCRNTLMYLNAETQAHVLARFNFALREGGHLMLGKAEMLLAHSNLFSSVDLNRRVFRKVPGATLRDRLMVLTEAGEHPTGNPESHDERTRNAALEANPGAQIVVDSAGHLMMATAGPAPCSTCGSTTSPARSRTWRSPTGRWSCAPRSSRSMSIGARRRSTRSSGSLAPARLSISRYRSCPSSNTTRRCSGPVSASPT